MNSRNVARCGRIAVAVAFAAVFASQAMPAQAAALAPSTLTVSGIVLNPVPPGSDPTDSYFSFDATAVAPTSTGLGLVDIGVGPLTLANPAFTVSGPPFGTTATAFAFDFRFTLQAPSAMDAFTFQDTINFANISNFTLALLDEAKQAVPGGGVVYNDGTNVELQYANLTSGNYVLEVLGAVPDSGMGGSFSGAATVSPVPLPGALLLFGTGIGGLLFWSRRKAEAVG